MSNSEVNDSEQSQQKTAKRGCLIFAIFFVVFVVVFAILMGINPWSSSTTSDQTFYIGETVSDGNVSITVTEVENAQSFGLYSTTHNFVIIYFTVTNRTNSSIDINPLYCRMTKGSTEYDCKTYDHDIYGIVAGGTESLYMVYETTQTTENATFVMSFGYSLAHAYAIDITLKEKES